jgi:phospholipid-transporting ATPase
MDVVNAVRKNDGDIDVLVASPIDARLRYKKIDTSHPTTNHEVEMLIEELENCGTPTLVVVPPPEEPKKRMQSTEKEDEVISKLHIDRVKNAVEKTRNRSNSVVELIETGNKELTGLGYTLRDNVVSSVKKLRFQPIKLDKKSDKEQIEKLNEDDDLEEMKEVQDGKTVAEHVVYINDSKKNRKNRGWWRYPNNYIKSTKYTWWNFVPYNLFEQFRRVSNLYFLLTMIVTLIPNISPINPYTTIVPLVLILLLTMLKDGYEDFQRYLSDRKANNEPIHIVNLEGHPQKEPTYKLEIGDIVRVDRDKPFPADIILLSSTNISGSCYVETANLDGETNLKTKRSVVMTQEYHNDNGKYGLLRGIVDMEKPNEHLDRFVGKLSLKHVVTEGETTTETDVGNPVSLGIDNLLLRGTVLRNTRSIYGVVVYAGKETKLAKNMRDGKSKFSLLDKRLNWLLLFLLIAQQVICAIFVTLAALFQNNTVMNSFYIRPLLNYYANATSIISDWVTYFILLNLVIPMSLFVSLEFIKAFQAKLMEADNEMIGYRDDGSYVRMIAKTSNLNQELSQLDIIFTDKTGTLTENKMEFASSWIAGTYFNAPSQVLTALSERVIEPDFRRVLHEYWMCILLNHASIPETKDTNDPDSIVYTGPSADENALLRAARDCGYKLLDRTSSGLYVEVLGEKIFYEVLVTLDFTSERKRSSVIVRSQTDGKIILYTKGADTIMFERTYGDVEGMTDALSRFSIEGLRTLVMSYRELTLEEFDEWMVKYTEANNTIVNRKYLVGKVSNELERNLELLGCSGIEDKLQEGVPEAIDFLLRASFQVWVLTGDKTETAVNISYSANVLRKGETIEIRVQEPHSRDHCEQKFDKAIEFLETNRLKLDQFEFALVIDTRALKYALTPQLQEKFLKVVSYCKSAICCRCTPLQKARVARLVETKQKKKGLAIGDGVNDVSMIQSCTVGVGIIGREGSQAARASDYAIPKFAQLVRLLAVHGHYSYVRNSDYLHLSFYKNMIVVYCQLLYAIFNGFTGQTLFDSWVITIYNSVFTFLPPMIIGVFEKDLPESLLLTRPELYPTFKNDALFNIRTMTIWLIRPLWHACVLYFGTYLSGWSEGFLGNEKQDGLWIMGSIVMSAAIVTIMLRHSLEFKNWTIITVSVMVLSCLSYFVFCVIYTPIPWFFDGNLYYFEFYHLAQSGTAWLTFIILVAICILPDLAIKTGIRMIFPRAWEKVLIENDTRNIVCIRNKRASPATTEGVSPTGEAPTNASLYSD